MTAEINPDVAREPTDVAGRQVAALLGGIAAILVVCLLALWVAFPRATADRVRGPTQPLPPEPRLQANPPADLQALRAREDRRLSSYGWVDRDHGIAHIPIDAAMRQIAAHGIPEWPAPGH